MSDFNIDKIDDDNIEDTKILQSETQDEKEEFYSQPFHTELKLTGQQKKDLADDVYNKIEKSITDSAQLLSDLDENDDLYDNIVTPKDTPWPDASNTSVPICTIKTDGIVDKCSQAITEISPNYVLKNPQWEKEMTTGIEEWFQDILDEKIGFKLFVEGNLHNAVKQFSGISILLWERQVKERQGVETYKDEIIDNIPVEGTGLLAFKKKYPSHKKAQCSKKEYREIKRRLKDEGYCRINIKYNSVKEGPKLENINRRDYIPIPFEARNQDEMIGEFMRINKTKQDLLVGVKNGEYEDKDIKTLLDKIGKKDKKNKNKDKDKNEDEPRKCYTGWHLYSENEDEIKEPILVTMDFDQKHIIKVDHFPYFDNESFFYQTKIKSFPGKFDGLSIPHRLKYTKYELDTMRNQRIDAWTLLLMKIFMINANAEFPEEDPRDGIKPGDTFVYSGVPAGEAIQELIKLPTGIPNFSMEESSLLQFSDWLSGLGGGLVYQKAAGAATAAEKTMGGYLATLREASVRIAAYIRHIRIGLNKIAKGIMWRQYQFGPDLYKQGDVTFSREDINPDNIQIDLRVSEKAMSQALMKEEIVMIMDRMLQMPLTQQNMLGQQDLIKTFLDEWNYKGNKDVVSMTPEELMDIIIQRMKEQEEQAKQEQMDEVGEKIRKQEEKMDPKLVDEVLDERTRP